MGRTVSWVKGHGTENDFVLLLDPDGTVYADLDAEAVRLLCNRRRGVGADGLLRAVRHEAGWFMDFRNADGSVGEMCGNGVRVFARFLVASGVAEEKGELPVVTLAGPRPVRFDPDGLLTVDMGAPAFPGPDGVTVTAGGHTWPAVAVDMGNPHAVAFVDDLADPGPLVDPPTWDPPSAFPKGVNVEFAVRRGDRHAHHLAMRVHERGVGETRSCGTGVCAVVFAAAELDGKNPGTTYRVDVPGGSLTVTFAAAGHVEMTGPAELTARGEIELP